MNYVLLDSFISSCQTSHSLCSESEDQRDLSHISLVDCLENKFSREASTQTYLALSYVWGLPSQPAYCKSNINTHDESSFFDTAPLTIRDAMDEVRKLNRRYLWVDKSCIE